MSQSFVWLDHLNESSPEKNCFNFIFPVEISKSKEPSLYGLKLSLQIFDYCTLTIFVLEIIVKWIDGFWRFWNNGWNIFDFIVTVMVCINSQLLLHLLSKSDSQLVSQYIWPSPNFQLVVEE